MIKLSNFKEQITKAKEKGLEPKYFVFVEYGLLGDSKSLELREVKERDFKYYQLTRVQSDKLIPRVIQVEIQEKKPREKKINHNLSIEDKIKEFMKWLKDYNEGCKGEAMGSASSWNYGCWDSSDEIYKKAKKYFK